EVAVGPAGARTVIEEVLGGALLLQIRAQHFETFADRRLQARRELGVRRGLTLLRERDLGRGARLFGRVWSGLRHRHMASVGVVGESLRRFTDQLMNAGSREMTTIPTQILSSRLLMPGKIVPSGKPAMVMLTTQPMPPNTLKATKRR